MTPRISLAAVQFILHALTSCASPHTFALTVQPEITGPFASSLSRADVVQITELPFTRDDIPRKTVGTIYMRKRDEADIRTTLPRWPDDKYADFKVRKSSGAWHVVDGSVQVMQVYFTD